MVIGDCQPECSRVVRRSGIPKCWPPAIQWGAGPPQRFAPMQGQSTGGDSSESHCSCSHSVQESQLVFEEQHEICEEQHETVLEEQQVAREASWEDVSASWGVGGAQQWGVLLDAFGFLLASSGT